MFTSIDLLKFLVSLEFCWIPTNIVKSWFFSFVKMLPVIFISLIVCWSYYAYVVAVILTVMTDVTEQVICGIIFHMITLMFVWSYYMIVFSPPGSVPVSWKLSQAELQRRFFKDFLGFGNGSRKNLLQIGN